jgi:hypothetical protein
VYDEETDNLIASHEVSHAHHLLIRAVPNVSKSGTVTFEEIVRKTRVRQLPGDLIYARTRHLIGVESFAVHTSLQQVCQCSMRQETAIVKSFGSRLYAEPSSMSHVITSFCPYYAFYCLKL